MANTPDSGSAAVIPLGGAVRPEDLSTERIEGLFYKHQIPSLFVTLARKLCTGRVILTQGAVVRTVGVVDGLPVFAMSSLANEHLGNRLVAQGRLTAAQAVMAESLMRTEGIRFGEALMRLEFFNQAELDQVLADQRNWVMGKCLEATGLRASFRPGDAVAEITSPAPLLTVIEGKVSAYSPSEIDTLTRRLGEKSYVLTRDAYDLARRLGASKKFFDAMSAATSGPFRLQNLLASSSNRIPAATAVTLVLCGLAEAAGDLTPSQMIPEHTPANPSATWPSTVVKPKGRPTKSPALPPDSAPVLDTSIEADLAVLKAQTVRPGVPLSVYYVSSILTLLGGVAIGVTLFLVLSRSATQPAAPSSAPAATAQAGTAPQPQPNQGTGSEMPAEEPRIAPLDDDLPPLAEQPTAVAQPPTETENPTNVARPTPAAPTAPTPRALPALPRETDAASAASPEEIAFRLALLKKLIEQHNFRRAVTVAREVLELDPRNPTAYLDLGTAYTSLGSREIACEAFRRYLRVAGNTAERADVEQKIQSCPAAAHPSP